MKDISHGTVRRYRVHHCRCLLCRVAESNRRALYRANPTPKRSAALCKAHLEWLGLGGLYKTSKATGVAKMTIRRILRGDVKRVLQRTEAKILAVSR